MRPERQGLHRATGVILRRNLSPEGDITLLCLLRDRGPTWISLPGGGRGKVRLGGSTEPMVWGEFSLYRSRSRDYLREVEVKRDFWGLRSKIDQLRISLGWCKLLSERLPVGQPVDEVLPVLFWSMDLLESETDPCGVDLRFTWRLLRSLGIAPSIRACDRCGRPISRGVWTENSFLCDHCYSGGRYIDLSLASYWIFSHHDEIEGKKLSDNEKKLVLSIKNLIERNLRFLS